MKEKRHILVSVVGPTAVGKTKFAIELAQAFGTEILSVDSRQFYREMQIGTAKPSPAELAMAPHHLVDSHSIGDYYSVGMFETEARALLERLFEKHQVVVAVGGSGLFFKALWYGLDEMPEVNLEVREALNRAFEEGGLEPLLEELQAADPVYYEQVDRQNHQRVIRALEVIRTTGQPFSFFRKGKTVENQHLDLKIGLEVDRATLYARIDQRMDQMIAEGLFEEAERLLPFREHNALQTVGYTEIFDFLDGKYDREEAVRLLKRNSRRYAKRQMTWFKKDETIHWMHPGQSADVVTMVRELLGEWM